MMIKIELPIRTVSEANAREHWRRKSQRAKSQRALTSMAVSSAIKGDNTTLLRCERIAVTLTRLGVRMLDSDNLQSSFKAVRDGVADAVGIDDGSSFYTWVYKQEQSKTFGIRIEIEKAVTGLVAMEI